MINWKHIRQLEEDVGSEDLDEVVSLFVAEVDEAVAELAKQPPQGPEEMADAMHFLKGSAFNLGFQVLGEFCAKAETAARQGNWGDVSLRSVGDIYAESKDQFFADFESRGRTKESV